MNLSKKEINNLLDTSSYRFELQKILFFIAKIKYKCFSIIGNDFNFSLKYSCSELTEFFNNPSASAPPYIYARVNADPDTPLLKRRLLHANNDISIDLKQYSVLSDIRDSSNFKDLINNLLINESGSQDIFFETDYSDYIHVGGVLLIYKDLGIQNKLNGHGHHYYILRAAISYHLRNQTDNLGAARFYKKVDKPFNELSFGKLEQFLKAIEA